MNKKTLIGLMAVALVALPIFHFAPNLVVITSKSIDKRFLYLTDQIPEKGDYAMFDLAHELVGETPVQVTKQLSCYAGDILSVRYRSYYCNDEYLGYARVKGRKEQNLPQFVFNGIIPEGKAFAFGSHPSSFDSRYWGFLEIEKAAKLKPLFDF